VGELTKFFKFILAAPIVMMEQRMRTTLTENQFTEWLEHWDELKLAEFITKPEIATLGKATREASVTLTTTLRAIQPLELDDELLKLTSATINKSKDTRVCIIAFV